MALSDVAKTTGVAPTGETPSTNVTQTVGGKTGDKRHEQFAASGASIREKLSDEEKQLEGSKSDKVVYLGALGDPAKPQSRKQDNKDIPSYAVVGYAFKALEDITVPRADLNKNFKNLMDVGALTEEAVKAGETFYLNVFEMGAFVSKSEYAGKISGEGNSVIFNVKYSKNRVDPMPVLNKEGGKGSVKENMILIADTSEVDGKKVHKIKDDFAAKFGVLYEKRLAPRKGGAKAGSTATGESTKNIAAAFQQYLKNRQ